MEKIILVEKWKYQAYRVTFESGEKIYVSEDLLVKENLFKDKELTETDLKQLKERIQIDRGYQLALKYLSYQMRSKKEISSYLKKHEIESTYLPEILKKLEEVGMIDDQNYADSYVRTMIKTSDKGPKVISQQLKKRGVDEEEIANALEIFDEEELFIIAKRTAEKLVYKYRRNSNREVYQKIQYQLNAKGFSPDTIREVMDELVFKKELDEEFETLCEVAERCLRRYNHLSADKRLTKLKQYLFQKGYPYDLIQKYIDEKIDIEVLDE